MKNKLWVLTVAAVLMFVPKVHAACLATGFIVDGNDLTAAMINPSNVSVPAVLNAAGCNIGIYYDFAAPSQQATLLAKEINGSGLLRRGRERRWRTRRRQHAQQPDPQHRGLAASPAPSTASGLYLRSYNAFNVTGNVTGNVIYTYQKGGIVANGPGVKLTKLDNNLIVGQGHVTTIAQNGIQIGFGALP